MSCMAQSTYVARYYSQNGALVANDKVMLCRGIGEHVQYIRVRCSEVSGLLGRQRWRSTRMKSVLSCRFLSLLGLQGPVC